jgi:hypothetical protein
MEMVQRFCDAKKNFVWQQTSQTSVLKIPSEKKQYVILDKLTKKSVFNTFSKVKSYIKNSNLELDEVPKHLINYYSLSQRCKNNFYSEKVSCIDITSAYPTTAFLSGIIDENLFNALNEHDKLDRLKILGMLASKKTQLNYINGDLSSYEIIENNYYANYFFYIQYLVGELMQEIEKGIGDNFLFMWVDGVYFTGGIDIENKVISIIEKSGYKWKYEYYVYFQTIIELKNNRIKINIGQNKNNIFKEKTFNLPLQNKNKSIINNLIKTIK